MKYLPVALVILSLFGCSVSPTPLVKLTDLEQQVVESYPIEKRAYMQSCLSEWRAFSHCQERMIAAFNPPSTVVHGSSGGSGIGAGLVGAAVGYGLGKSSRRGRR